MLTGNRNDKKMEEDSLSIHVRGYIDRKRNVSVEIDTVINTLADT